VAQSLALNLQKTIENQIKSIFVQFDGMTNYHNCHRRKSDLHKHNVTRWAKNKINVRVNVPSNFFKSVCTQNFLCATFYQHSSIFRRPCT